MLSSMITNYGLQQNTRGIPGAVDSAVDSSVIIVEQIC